MRKFNLAYPSQSEPRPSGSGCGITACLRARLGLGCRRLWGKLNLGCGTLGLMMGLMSQSATAEILTLSGSAEASVEEVRSGAVGDTDQASDIFPTTSSELPLQVVAQLIAVPAGDGAAVLAAQFADPRDLPGPNPEEFAINLALSSISDTLRYTGRAKAEEERDVIFSAAELGVAEGETARIAGTVFVDGALTVFSGAIELRGAPAGGVDVAVEGAFPFASLILSDLSIVSDEFAALHVLVIPPLTIGYEYDAVAGEEFTLRATVAVEAANLEGETGVAAVIGTPTDALSQVIAITQGAAAATKMLTTLSQERANPSGVAAVQPTLGLCGLSGFGATALLLVLAFVSRPGRVQTTKARRHEGVNV